MKKILFIAFVCLLQSCATTYYQVYELGSNIETSDTVVYSDKNCDVIYDFWADGGDMSFVFKNKTDYDIIIDLKKSFLIKNGLAMDYYDNNSYTNTTEIGYSSTKGTSYGKHKSMSVSQSGYYLWTPTNVNASASVNASAGVSSSIGGKISFSVTENPVEYIIVPAHAYKIVKGFSISDYVYTICEERDFNWPNNESRKIEYTKEASPLNLKNKIVYRINEEEHLIENDFWVKSLKNYSEGVAVETKFERDCVTGIGSIQTNFKIGTPSMFYNIY